MFNRKRLITGDFNLERAVKLFKCLITKMNILYKENKKLQLICSSTKTIDDLHSC